MTVGRIRPTFDPSDYFFVQNLTAVRMKIRQSSSHDGKSGRTNSKLIVTHPSTAQVVKGSIMVFGASSVSKVFSTFLLIASFRASVTAMRTVLVTGGNRGIGLAICQRILEETSDVKVLLGSRDLGRGQQAADYLKKQISNCQERLEVIEMDTSSDESVKKAASQIDSLYGIVNNAGVLDPPCINTNYFGPRRVNDALEGVLQRPGGRIVNIASASGPNYVSRLNGELKEKLAMPWKIKGGIPELDELALSMTKTDDNYGSSKALLNAYTRLHAKAEPDLIINSVTPGFIASDMGKSLGATKPIADGAIPPVNLLLNEEFSSTPTGRYYGSDTKRSPLDVYRGPGDPVYVGPDWETVSEDVAN